MSEVQTLQKGLIDIIQSIQDKDLLKSISQLLESMKGDEIITLSAEQEVVLKMSEEDIREGRTISQEDLDKEDLKWLGK